MMKTVHLRRSQILLTVLFTGGFALLYAIAGVTRKFLLFPLIAIPQAAGMVLLGRTYEHNLPLVQHGSGLPEQLQVLGWGATAALTASYVFFVVFFSREGERYFRAHTEITLARELHQALVPEIQRTIGNFEIYGASVPSGEVGGDLVDLVQYGDDWTAYVADVSGHGVAPGVLMAMFKASVRTCVNECDASVLLATVHQALYPLKTSNMFLTAGVLEARADRLRLSLAGHPPLLHFQRQTNRVTEYGSEDLPLGILPQQTFASRSIEIGRGDVLVLLTDGITEVSDSSGTELGVDAIKSSLPRWADLPLPKIFSNARELALQFGKQLDDQTMLLVRRSA